MTATQLIPRLTSTTQPTPSFHLGERHGRAMGSSLHIVATGDETIVNSLLDWAVNRVDELEQRWSRFIATSEVSRLNAAAGTALTVSSDTLTLVERSIEARQLSSGRFDPTMLQAMHANGYDRTFVSIKTPVGLPALDTRTIGLGTISVDREANTVTLGATTGFDPGGIGKGLAADMVAQEMIERGAQGVLVNIGGDLRCIGEGPADGNWIVAVGDAVAGVPHQVLEIASGGVASSTYKRRQWKRQTPDGPATSHHLIDPATGRPALAAANLVTVIAGCCADAEWIATAVAAEGTMPADQTMFGKATVMLTNHHGEYSTAGDPERFVR